jgi:1-acyl-sn-glycerol-3-phosphate acyltransferase
MIPSSLIPLPRDPEIVRRVGALELPFGSHGIDPYGIDQDELAGFFTLAGFLYHRYFGVEAHGADNIPARGRAMLVGNHTGGWGFDAGMVIAAAFFELNPPRLAQGMADKFIQKVPFLSQFTGRIGQVTGLPQHCVRLLEDERLLLVYPEGARGTAKLRHESDSLVEFGSGFARLALQTRTPIIPFGFIGGGEALPTVMNLYKLGRLIGVPYIPITTYGIAWPLPVPLQILFGAPIELEGSHNDTDEHIVQQVARVKNRIRRLIRQGRALRAGRIQPTELDLR